MGPGRPLHRRRAHLHPEAGRRESRSHRLAFRRGLGLDTIGLGEVPDLEGDDVGQVVLGEIGANVGDEVDRNLVHIEGRRTLAELERDDAIFAELEESGVHVVGVGLLDDSGLGPSKLFETDVRLEANGPDGEGTVGTESVDAEDVAHAVVLYDLERGHRAGPEDEVERECWEGYCTCDPVNSQH